MANKSLSVQPHVARLACFQMLYWQEKIMPTFIFDIGKKYMYAAAISARQKPQNANRETATPADAASDSTLVTTGCQRSFHCGIGCRRQVSKMYSHVSD
jgi:hypothetical protein